MSLINPVLIVVDLQVGFLNEHSTPVIDSVRGLIKEARVRQVPVLFTRFRNLPNSPFEKLVGWTKVRDKPETDLYPMMFADVDHHIEKLFYTACTNEFLALAAQHSWRTLVICGLSTESCILKTAVDAFEHRFTPIVVADACASDLGRQTHLKGLEIIRILIGNDQVMNIHQLLPQL